MKVQLLIVTMNQNNLDLLDDMNVQTDALVGNQCDKNEVVSTTYKSHNVTCYSFAERGVGLNRNNLLMRATGDICIFADDDMRYVDNYDELIIDAFNNNPSADVIVFNISNRKQIKKKKRVRFYNFLRYGTARVAIKLKSVRQNGIYFNLCFGGGTEHCHGEDNLFLAECLKKGLKIYAEPVFMAELTENRVSTWDTKDVDKYLRDQGVLYRTISRKWWKLLCFQDALRRHKSYGASVYKCYKKMVNGYEK